MVLSSRLRYTAFCGLTLGLLGACTEKHIVIPPEEPIPFDYSVEGLPDAVPTSVLEAKDGDTVRLSVGYVKKTVSGSPVRMLAYNRSIPGPTIKVPEGAKITLLLTNEIGLPTSLHSHGIRLDWRYDGMPGLSQPPVDSGETFAYSLHFPDPGVYWYHPHVRESYGLELGLYGNYLVVPADTAYWPAVHREEMLVFDDILTENGRIRPFYKNITDFTMMGRFGNAFLVNGAEGYVMKVKRGEVIRFYATNVSGSRTYNLRYSDGTRLHLVGADNGRNEYSHSRAEAIIAPSERLVFQAQFLRADKDTIELQNFPRGPYSERMRVLMRFVFEEDSVATDLSASLAPVHNADVAADIDAYRGSFNKEPDEELFLTGYMDHGPTQAAPSAKITTAHDSTFTDRMGIEWYDHMFNMNRISDTSNMRWFARDVKTGKENHAIHWIFKTGDHVLIRIRNDTTSTSPVPGRMMHPMPHPIHFHGQRFLVLREGPPSGMRPNVNGLVWRDSYLIGTGFTVDILLDAANPGKWMFHCHIPEHLESDMMGHFDVVDPAPLVKGTASSPR